MAVIGLRPSDEPLAQSIDRERLNRRRSSTPGPATGGRSRATWRPRRCTSPSPRRSLAGPGRSRGGCRWGWSALAGALVQAETGEFVARRASHGMGLGLR
jgi:hypothetical protein